ncbi:MAG: hypothetical protein AAF802_23585 [Planctomycetota bacterium]
MSESASVKPSASMEEMELTLGGSEGDSQYPEISLDPEGEGVWGLIDRWTERATHWFNPILIKEARQSLKSRQFLVTYFCVLVASCGWTILGVVFNAPEIYFIPRGEELLAGYFLILAVSLLAFVPLVAFRSLAAELDEGTYEMLAITRLTAWRIVVGKMNSAILQMLIYVSAIVPCLAFCYLLRGVSLMAIVASVTIVFVASLLVVSFGLMLSTISKGRSSQTFLLVGYLALLIFVFFLCCSFVFEVVFREEVGGEWFGFVLSVVMAFSFVILFLAAAAASVAPITENRSTRLRAILFVQQVLWTVLMTYFAWTYAEPEILNVGMLMMTLFWMVVGVFMCGESWELSPRVRRDLPKTYATRMLLSWWMPGPGSGFMFVISTAISGLLIFALFYVFQINWSEESPRNVSTWPGMFALLSAGYLSGYLGLTRLISMPWLRRFGPSFITPIVVAMGLIFLGTAGPAMIEVLFTGSVSPSITPFHAGNFFWAWGESFGRRLPAALALLVFVAGSIVLVLNAAFLLREFRQRRSETPLRVQQSREAN